MTNSAPQTTILELKEVHKTFQVGKNQLEIIKGVSFSINRGDFVILFGPSGCGKSTVLNILLGLEPPTTGTVEFLGDELYQHNEDDRSEIRKNQVGMVYQQSNWIKSLNVLENVSFPLTLKGVSRPDREAKALEMLRLVDLESGAYQKPGELSSGQQQRVSLARALITDPVLIVADEPTGNLDSKASEEIMHLFKSFNEQEKTVIMVTHDLEYLRFASRAIQMTDGVVVKLYSGSDAELKQYSVSKRGTVQSGVETDQVVPLAGATAVATPAKPISSAKTVPIETVPMPAKADTRPAQAQTQAQTQAPIGAPAQPADQVSAQAPVQEVAKTPDVTLPAHPANLEQPTMSTPAQSAAVTSPASEAPDDLELATTVFKTKKPIKQRPPEPDIKVMNL
jgi:putative ABC transport system ATP-binding protein